MPIPAQYIRLSCILGGTLLRGLPVALLLIALLCTAACRPKAGADNGPREIRWGTSAVGSSGHRALVNLAALLNREIPEIRITVLPMPGAIMGVRRYTASQLDGFYGSDIAFHELASGSSRFEGFEPERDVLQSFWAYTMETGFAIRRNDRDRLKSWSALESETVFTGPLPWDTRAHLERLLSVLGVEHDYVELDLGMAGTQLGSGAVAAVGVYTTGEREVAPWVAEMELGGELAVLNPSPAEQATIREAGIELISASPAAFETDVQVDELILSPFYYGFHLGADFSEETVYRMLITIEAHAAELAAADAVFSQIATDMPELQRRGIERSAGDARIHPGLARYLRECGVWDPAWDARVAEPAAR